VAVRNRLAGLSQDWRGLTAAQRSAWNAAVSDFAKTDVFGDLKNPSGFNLYCKLNANLLNCGESAITSPPTPQDILSLTSVSLTVESSTDKVEIAFAPALDADNDYIVFATPPLSPGVNFVKSEYRQIDILASGDTTPVDVTTEYKAKFGSVGSVGQKVFVKLVPVNLTSGQQGTPLSASDLVEAGT
jgi:hypothetical protein